MVEKHNYPKKSENLWTVKLGFNGGTSMDYLTNLDSETLKAELLAFLEEQFVEFIKDDLSYAD